MKVVENSITNPTQLESTQSEFVWESYGQNTSFSFLPKAYRYAIGGHIDMQIISVRPSCRGHIDMVLGSHPIAYRYAGVWGRWAYRYARMHCPILCTSISIWVSVGGMGISICSSALSHFVHEHIDMGVCRGKGHIDMLKCTVPNCAKSISICGSMGGLTISIWGATGIHQAREGAYRYAPGTPRRAYRYALKRSSRLISLGV